MGKELNGKALSFIYLSSPENCGVFYMDRISATKKIAGIAIFASLSFITSTLEFVIFPATSFLKMDFSLVFVFLAGFLFGPISGVFTCLIKELLCLFKSSSGGIGELANFLSASSFILLPTTIYYFKKGFKVVIITLIISCFIQVGVALFVNRFINFPLYMGEGAQNAFISLWQYIALFNAIKSFSICIVTILLYKRVSILFRKI